MRIVELKSQSVKIIYKPAIEQLKTGDFISFTEGEITLIAQVYKILTSDAADDFNQADLSFVLTCKYDKITPWRGEFVSANALVEKTSKDFIENYINTEKLFKVLHFGQSTQYGIPWSFDFNNLVTPAFVGYEKREDNINFIKLLANNFCNINEKLVIIDFKGNLNINNSKKIFAGDQVKLPLNAKILESLCSNTLQGVSLESKAVIEDVLIELSEYSKTTRLGFIPITNLINVIDNYYKQSKISPLLLLKNKLRHYQKLNIFADKKEEITALYSALEKFNIVVFDLSNVPFEWQNEFFLNLIENRQETDFYMNVTLDENNSNNKIINYLLFKASNNGIKPILSANYRYLSFDNIFDFCDNAFLFKTCNALKKRQNLTDILQTLSSDSFLTIGKLSKGLAISSLIINGDEIEELDIATDENDLIELEEITENVVAPEVNTHEIETMNNVLSPEPSISLKNPMEYVNQPINHVQSSQNYNVEQSINNNDEKQEISEVEKVNNEKEINLTENQEQVEESTEIIQQDNNLENIQKTEPEVEQVVLLQTNETHQNDINDTEQSVNNDVEIKPSEENNQILSNSNILEEVEEVDIPDVNEDNITIQDISKDDILDLVESENSVNEDDILFEEISQQEPEVELENLNVDDLDFLTETDNQEEVSDSDDELLDLINADNQDQNNDSSFDDIEFEENQEYILEEEKTQISELSEKQKTLPVYNANDYEQPNVINDLNLNVGDLVKHDKYGVGTINKITSRGDKILCHINFDNCGRRLLDPLMQKVEKIN